MSDPIRIAFKDNAEHMLEANEQAPEYRKFHLRIWLFLAFIFGVVPIPNLIMQIRAGQPRYAIENLTILSGMFFLVWLFGIVPTKRNRLRYCKKAYRRLHGRDEMNVECEFGEAGFEHSTDQGTTSQHLWSSVQKAVERPGGILIYTGPRVIIWYPKRYFKSADSYEQLLQIIQRTVTNFQRLNG
jgi:hypothetical protein